MDPNSGVSFWEAALDQFIACFEGLKDPRTGNAGLHDLHELLFIALCAVLSGGQGVSSGRAVSCRETIRCPSQGLSR